jgi:hypothetical protein
MANKSGGSNPTFNAEDKSSASERRDRQLFQDLQKQRTETDAKTARLKALRLEKEKAEAEAAALNPPAKKKRVEAKT